jgi:hypothetical protein
MKMNSWRFPLLASLLLGASLLAGCASTYMLESEVLAFTSLTALPEQPGYRFERLPSQQVPGQAELENMADPALHRAGLRRDDANPKYSVQIGVRVQQVMSPWARPWGPWGGWGSYHRGFYYRPLMSDYDWIWYQREVSVVVRELSSNRVVFESRATSDGPSVGGVPVLQAMFDAALQGFPTPPTGPFRVNTPVPS